MGEVSTIGLDMAQSGHTPVVSRNVRFWGVKRTKSKQGAMSAYDPKRT
jgi:hypothetical protein